MVRTFCLRRYSKSTLLWLPWIASLASLVGCGGSPQSKEANFLKRGDRFAQEKDWQRALLEYRAAAQKVPKDAEPYFHLGMAYEQMSDPENAVRAYRQSLERNPNHAGAQLKLAGIMARNGNQQVLEEAEKRLRGFVQTSAGNSEALDFLAVTEFRLGRVQEAGKLLEQATEKYPSDLESARLLAELRLKQNDFPGAEQVLKSAAGRSPNSPEAALALGRFYMLAQRPDQAQAEFRRALAVNPQFSPALLSLALLLTNANQIGQAEAIYKRLSAGLDKDDRYLYGLFLFQHGRTDAALDEFRRLAREDASDRAARSRLVAAYIALNRIPEARKILGDALNANQKDNDALLQRAGLYLRTGQPLDAERDLQQVINNQPDSAPAHFEMAIAKRMRGLNKSERQELIEALLHHPEYLPARLALARHYVSAQEPKSALELLDAAPPEQRNLREVRIERNWALLGAGDREAARAGIQQLLASSRTADVLEQDGFMKMSTRDFAGARRDADEILAQNMEALRGVRLMIDSYAAENQSSLAIRRLREMVAVHPKSAPLQHALGEALLASGNRKDSRSAFESAVAANPGFVPAQLSLGLMDFQDRRLDAARTHVTAALAADPGNITALSAAGDIELRAGAYSTALDKYRAVLDVDPDNVPALTSSASLHVLNNQLDQALSLAQHAVQLTPDNPRTQDTLAWVYYRQGNFTAATEFLKKAVSREPTAPRQYHLALAYLKNGQATLASTQMQAALQKDPDLPKKDRGW